jgi:3-oxoacyl-[acyl-carrier protein] reductase|tara:strand:- start:3548 stop:4300 length:753 start_codon:yes stop_codon:yes gene_type:complete
MIIDFKDQIILVTGATRGIGKQIADDLHDSGAQLVLTGTKKEVIESLNREANRSKSNRKEYLLADFTDPLSTESFLNAVKCYDRIDVCINNAGINRINYIDEIRYEDWADINAVNLSAPLFITREISRIMKKNKYGRIVNISSIFGSITKEKRSLYSMSKFGLQGLTIASALDLAKYNILINSVSPGFVHTDLTESILSREDIKELAKQVPLGRFATPEEISKTVMFLASKHNTYITGQNIIVDGGFVNV